MLMDRLSIRVLVATLCLHCGNTSSSTAPVPTPTSPPGCEALGTCGVARASEDSRWHPDPDGDGIPSAVDHCPNIYDVAQGDADGDGIGDFCDSDFVTLRENGPIVDLRAQHVTPYGGWFGFTSPKTTKYGQDYVIAWSTNADELRSGKAIRNLAKDRQSGFRVFAYAGYPLVDPQIITEMEPKTKYYVAVAPLDDYDKPTEPVSNIAVITTSDAPALRIPSESPRVLSTPSQLQELASRHTKGDKSWKKWANVMGDSVLEAARSRSKHDFGHCLSAALLYHGTGSAKYKDAALTLVESMRKYWQENTLENNQLRWADANLGLCADLMWNELSDKERNAVVAAFLDDDEAASIARKVDTDEFASITRTWIVDGLVGCNAKGVSPALSKRACALLERGKRAFYGVQLVKARRNEGFFAQSGGNLPDGIGYAFGTSSYWLKTLIALGNVGGEADAYAPWVWHNLQAMQIQSLTPRRLGYATFGDLDSYDNFGVEPNSHPILPYNGGLVAMHMGLLARAGKVDQARHARWHLDNLFPDDDFGGSWAMLLYSHDGLAPLEDRDGMPTSFFDASMGLLFDRTSWEPGASFFTFKAGWSGADHTHEDAGSFQLYRDGVWITNEDLGYDGPSSQAEGHNVPALEISFDDGRSRVGQFRLEPAKSATVLRQSRNATYTHVVADLTGAYSSGRHHSFAYQSVERHIVWLKPSKNNTDDRVVTYDRIIRAPKNTKARIGWQLHVNSEPTILGAQASLNAGAFVDVQLAFPIGATLQYEAPQGVHSQYPGERYTGRLVASAKASVAAVHFVSVLRASNEKGAKVVVPVESDNAIGAIAGQELVVFPKDAAAFPPGDLALSFADGAARTLVWTGLAPNASFGLVVERGTQGVQLKLTSGGSLQTDSAGVLVAAIEGE